MVEKLYDFFQSFLTAFYLLRMELISLYVQDFFLILLWRFFALVDRGFYVVL